MLNLYSKNLNGAEYQNVFLSQNNDTKKIKLTYLLFLFNDYFFTVYDVNPLGKSAENGHTFLHRFIFYKTTVYADYFHIALGICCNGDFRLATLTYVFVEL